MRKLLLFTFQLFFAHSGYSQAYVPMPVDSAVWRYRITDADYGTRISDNILFLNGRDTIANGNTYHRIISRTYLQSVPNGFVPPLVAVDANSPDFYYGAMRENGKKVFLLGGGGEKLIYDFTVAVGDSIPSYDGKDKVTAIDSVLLGGVYHKRYLTSDPNYFTLEGIGSNLGLIPDLNDGGSDIAFICLTDSALTYSPDPALPCTYVYPAGYVSSVAGVNDQLPEIKVFPVPANDILHIIATGKRNLNANVFNCIGQVMWSGRINEKREIPVSSWPQGLYYIQFTGGKTGCPVKKFIVN